MLLSSFVIIQWHRAKEIPELAVTTTSTLFYARNFFYKKKTFWSSSQTCTGKRQADFEWVLSPCQITNHSSKGDYSSWSCTQFMHQKCSSIAILLKGHQLHFVSVALTSRLQEKGRMSRIEPQGSNKINVTWLKTFPVTQTCMSSNLQGRPCFELLSSTFITKTVFVPVMKLAQYFFITATLADRQVSPQATATIKEIEKCAMWFRHAQEWTAALEKKLFTQLWVCCFLVLVTFCFWHNWKCYTLGGDLP